MLRSRQSKGATNIRAVHKMVDSRIWRIQCSAPLHGTADRDSSTTVTGIQLDGRNDAKCAVEYKFLERSATPEYDDDKAANVFILQEERYELVSVQNFVGFEKCNNGIQRISSGFLQCYLYVTFTAS